MWLTLDGGVPDTPAKSCATSWRPLLTMRLAWVRARMTRPSRSSMRSLTLPRMSMVSCMPRLLRVCSLEPEAPVEDGNVEHAADGEMLVGVMRFRGAVQCADQQIVGGVVGLGAMAFDRGREGLGCALVLPWRVLGRLAR